MQMFNKRNYNESNDSRFAILRCVLITAALVIVMVGCRQNDKPQIGLRSEINASDTLQLQSLEGTGIYADGWVGNVASIALANPQHTRVLSVSGVNVQTGMKDERLHLRIEYEQRSIDSIGVGQTGTFDEIVILPSAVSNKDTLQLRLIASKAFVPSQLGTSRDDRTLSFQLKQIALIDPATLAKKLPESFEFPSSEENNPNLLGVYKDGWIADSAVVTLHNLKGKISVEIQGFVPADIFPKIADLEISASGHLLVKEQITKKTGGFFRSLVQLPDEVAGLSKITLTLKPSGTFVPAERGINSDQRRISYRLQYIGLK